MTLTRSFQRVGGPGEGEVGRSQVATPSTEATPLKTMSGSNLDIDDDDD
jgi:hypothetical protein